MPSNDTCRSLLNIAGVRFILADLSAATAWPEAFHDFVGKPNDTDLDCEVHCQGPDEALAVEAPLPDTPWLFRAQDGQCELTRRAADGVAIWRIRAPLAFDRATITWHPQRFHAVYGDYVTSWTSALGLSLLIFRLRAFSGLGLHGSAAVLDGQGVLCSGVSGVGKSTISRLLHAAGASVLTDERPFVRQFPTPTGEVQPLSSAAFRVYGSPWPSSARFACNASAPLRRIYFLEHGPVNRLTPLTPREAFNQFVQVTTIPWHAPELFDPCLKTLDTLLHSVSCAVLSFRPTAEVVDLIRQDLAAQPRKVTSEQ